MGKKARANKKTARKSADKEETVRSNLPISHLPGDGINIKITTINQTFGEIEQPKGRAPLKKGDQAPPRQKKGAGSDKPLSDKGRKMLEETLSVKQPKGRAPLRKGDQAPPRKEIGATSDTDKENKPKAKGRAPLRKGDQAPPRKEIGATSDTDKEKKPKARCSKISTLLNNVDNTYEMIRVRIYDVEEELSTQKDINTGVQLPGVFRVADHTGWGYLIVSGPVNKKEILKPGNSIEVLNVKANNRTELICNSQDVRMSSESVNSSISIEDMEKDEKCESLSNIKAGHCFQKTKLVIFKVGEKKKIYRFGEFPEVIELEVRDKIDESDPETLEAEAKYDYKIGQEVKVRVRYNRDESKFQTSNHCVVKKLRDL